MQIKYARYHPDGSRNDFQAEMFADVTTKILLGDAGVGTGKTYDLCQKAIKLSFLNKDVAGGMLAPSYPEYQRDVVPNLEDILNENGIPYDYNQQKKTWRFPWSRKPMYVFTAEKRIKGPNLGWGCVNEYSSIPYERIEEFVDYRIRVPCHNPQVQMSGTPEDVYGWREDFIAKKMKANLIRIVNGHTAMNAFHLQPGFVEEKRATLDPLAFRLFIMGEALKINSNAFYYAWMEWGPGCLVPGLPQQFSIRKEDGHEIRVPQLIHVSLDFNVGNMSAVLANVVSTHQAKEAKVWRGDRDPDPVSAANEKELRVFGEISLKDKNADTYAMGNELIKRFSLKTKEDFKSVLVTGDASGDSRKTTGFSDFKVLEDMGFTVRWKGSNPRFRERQLLVNGLIANKRIRINPECKGLIRDLQLVEQDKRTFEKIKKNQTLTHLSDALDYLCDQEFELGLLGRQKFTVRSVHDFFG